jgi:eukaryotic-like serine/threonine-protein kinase
MRPLQPDDPREVGPYRLLARLGSGGMGTVFVGRSASGRTVSIKLVHPELARDPEFRRRFRHEVAAAGEVGGEFTAQVLDADTEAATPWLASAYIAGPTLQEVVDGEDGPLPERSLRVLAAGLGGALHAIHERGLVHRDLKPSNVLLTLDGPRVIDFGIARAVDAGIATRTGAVIGTPAFMSPEQVRGERVTAASDVFSLGSVLAYAATGRLPFAPPDGGVHALMMKIAAAEPDLVGLAGALRELVDSCLAKDPSARPSPQRIVERADADAAGLWLPPEVVDRLGRHAVALLDLEPPEAGGPGMTAADLRTAVGPTTHAGIEPPTYPVSRPPPRRRPMGDPPTDPPAHPPVAARPAPLPTGTSPISRAERPRALRDLVIAGAVLAALAAAAFVVAFTGDGAPASEANGPRRSSGLGPSVPPTTPQASPPATPTLSHSSAVRPPPSRSTVPSAFIGTWEGTSDDWETVRFVVRRGKIGSDVVTELLDDGRITCHLVGRLRAADDRFMAVAARQSKVTSFTCDFDTGSQTLTLTGDNTIRWEAPNDTDTATLRRVR